MFRNVDCGCCSYRGDWVANGYSWAIGNELHGKQSQCHILKTFKYSKYASELLSQSG